MLRLFSKIIFKLGAKYRNPELFQWIEFLLKSQYWTLEEFNTYKEKRLNKLLDFAKLNSLYYKNITINKESPLDSLKGIPTIDKNTLIENRNEISTEKKFTKLIESETSGSSGQALKFYRSYEWDTVNRASWMRCYSWYGVNPWDRNAYFWGYNFTKKDRIKTKILDVLQNRFRLFNYEVKEVDKFLKRLTKAVYLHGYSSMIYETALLAQKRGYAPNDFPKLKMIKGTSEKIYESYQEVVNSVFGLKIISEYGAAESGIIAFECPSGHMHINEESVVVEEVDNEMYVTNLLSDSFPIIRYKLGDAVKLAPYTVCSCGRQSNVVLEVLGRVGKNIHGFKLKYPSLTLYYIFKNIALNSNVEIQYQGFQEKIGHLELRFPKSLSKNESELIRAECLKYFKNDVVITFMDNMIIHTKDKKLKDFITSIE